MPAWSVLTQKAEFADGLRALDVSRKGLGVALNQPWVYQPVAAAFLQPADGLCKNEVRTERLTVALLGGQVAAGMRHVRAG